LKRLLFDLEGNGLLPELTKLHCIAATDVDTGHAVGAWGPNEIPQALEVMATADKLIAHYGLGYDFPALEKLYDFRVPIDKQMDTVVISRLKHPNIKETDGKWNGVRIARGQAPMGDDFGKHTIAAWGLRLGVPKLHTDIEDWSEWTKEMQERCVGDVATALKLWKYLDPDKYSQSAIALEHRVARLCLKITAFGWPFNASKAKELHATLIDEKYKVEKELKLQFGSWWKNLGEWTPKRPDKKRGYWGETTEVDAVLTEGGEYNKEGDLVVPYTTRTVKQKVFKGYPCTKIERVDFNPGSRDHIELCLKRLGWKPKEHTPTGKALLDEETIDGVVTQFPQAMGLSRYLMLAKRLGMIADGKGAWFKTVKDDGKMHNDYNPMGCITSRASHFNPNIAQVPACSSEYGHECRELFYVPLGWEMVGGDMSGLEGRCLAHYLAKHDSGAYGETFLKGDPHWAVVKGIGFLDCERDKSNQLHTIVREAGAKRTFYAMLYGAGDVKVGRIILDACRLARKTDPAWGYVYEKFFGTNDTPSEKVLRDVGADAKIGVVQGIKGFDRLKGDLQTLVAIGWLPGLDKRRIPIRSEHAALNTLLQSAGAILCKQWICDAYDALIADGLKWGWDGDFGFLGWIHDELQIACRNGLGDRIGATLTAAARNAGTPFKFRIALDSEYKIGRTWADTH
jgi:DNA polymerase-1